MQQVLVFPMWLTDAPLRSRAKRKRAILEMSQLVDRANVRGGNETA